MGHGATLSHPEPRRHLMGRNSGAQFKNTGIEEVRIAPRSPWQNPYVERLVGTLRRELLDHVVVLNKTHLRKLMRDFLVYYHTARCRPRLPRDCLSGSWCRRHSVTSSRPSLSY